MSAARRLTLVLAGAVLAVVVGCGDGGESPAPPGDDGHEAAAEAARSSRIGIPSAVRANLGVTFVTAERRRVEQTLRVPGRFELLPTARREYRTMLPGRVELLVEQFDRVEAGRLLYRIDSPSWRELQSQLSEAESTIARLTVKLDTFEPLMAAHDEHEESLEESVAIWNERVQQLEMVRDAGGGRISQIAEARSALATARAELSDVQEKKAQLRASRAEAFADLDAARSRQQFLLDSAASLLGVDAVALLEPVETGRGAHPRWRTIDRIDVRAEQPGAVESMGLTNGAWADEKTAVLTVVQPDRLRFRASGLQSDMGALRDGLPARIVPPTPTRAGRAIDLQETMSGVLALGLSGDPADRTIDLYVTPERLSTWARPGVSAQLEIVTDATAAEELAIPLAAVQRDGITPVIFRRDPGRPDEAIRLEADLGVDDGRWVAVLSGLRDGDQVVLDGAFQLMLATSGSIQKGGHFHSDGTFHEGED
jgi:multidrug efflux pump subunit AcrA (membrane-fusion protein)